MQHFNRGASVTNVAEFAVAHVLTRPLGPHASSDTDWAELDSAGRFDVLVPSIQNSRPQVAGGPPLVLARDIALTWKPPGPPGAPWARTKASFMDRFGQAAEIAWQCTQWLTYCAHACHFQAFLDHRGEIQKLVLVTAGNTPAVPSVLLAATA